jgi:hypothetical protein
LVHHRELLAPFTSLPSRTTIIYHTNDHLSSGFLRKLFTAARRVKKGTHIRKYNEPNNHLWQIVNELLKYPININPHPFFKNLGTCTW